MEQCKGVHCVDLGESFQTHVIATVVCSNFHFSVSLHVPFSQSSFQTHIYLQNFVSIQPRKSPVKFAASGIGPGFATSCRAQRTSLLAPWTTDREPRTPSLHPGGDRGLRAPALEGSFSAGSKPNFTSKYAFESSRRAGPFCLKKKEEKKRGKREAEKKGKKSSRRDLHNALRCTVLESNPKNQKNLGAKRTWSVL